MGNPNSPQDGKPNEACLVPIDLQNLDTGVQGVSTQELEGPRQIFSPLPWRMVGLCIGVQRLHKASLHPITCCLTVSINWLSNLLRYAKVKHRPWTKWSQCCLLNPHFCWPAHHFCFEDKFHFWKCGLVKSQMLAASRVKAHIFCWFHHHFCWLSHICLCLSQLSHQCLLVESPTSTATLKASSALVQPGAPAGHGQISLPKKNVSLMEKIEIYTRE